MPSPVALAVQSARRSLLSEEMRALMLRFGDTAPTIGDLLSFTEGRGFEVLLLLLTVPFLTPIPLPGLSTPFGAIVVMIGFRLALGRRPWLPQSLLRRQLPSWFIGRVLGATRAMIRWIEVVARPRFDFLHAHFVYRRIAGALITLSGLMLLLPVPVPFTNTLPALTVATLSVGALERDGVFFLFGCLAFAISLGYFLLLALGGTEALNFITQGWR